MITTIVASFALLAPPSGTWVATKLTPLSLAKRADLKMATVSQMKLTYHLDYQTDKEGYAFSNCEATIVRPGVFKAQIPLIKPHDRLFMYRENWVSDGKRFGRSVDPKLPVPGPLSLRPAPPARPLSIWFAQFPRVILSALGRPTRVFQSLVADAARQKFSTTVQTRSLTSGGVLFLSNRLVLAKGPVRYEIVFDGRQNLPVNVNNTIPNGSSRWAPVFWTPSTLPLTAKDVRFYSPSKR